MKVGARLALDGVTYEVVQHLGVGGEGDVFELGGGAAERRLALKWYHPHVATPSRRAALTELVERGAPSDAFLWPEALIEDRAEGRFGYVMGLRPPNFVSLAELLRGTVPRNEPAVARFAFELADAFRKLHVQGLCYRDINFGNAFVDPVTGAALICDNDNVGVEGVAPTHVLGSRRFMAPEIVRGHAVPSKVTDRWSLAVLLFYLLLVHHPLEGARTEVGLADAEADLRHYGTEPLFCFDPADASNRPVEGLHDHVGPMWRQLPAHVRSLFTRSFTTGVEHPRQRVVDSEWCDALATMLAHLVVCPRCGRSSVLVDGAVAACGTCGAAPADVLALRTDRHHVVLRPGTVLHAPGAGGGFDLARPLAVVERHPTRPDVLGLRNDTGERWRYVTPDGDAHAVPPGRRAQLDLGAVVEIDGHRWLVGTCPHASP